MYDWMHAYVAMVLDTTRTLSLIVLLLRVRTVASSEVR